MPTTLGQNYESRLLDASYLEDVLLTKTGSIANTLTIRPAAGVTTVLTGTFTFGAGSAYATLSGNNGTVARALTLRQPSLTVPAVAFGGDAYHNVVREVTVLGSNTVLTSGVVGDGNVAGNDYNTLTECFVGNVDPAQLPANLVYAASASGVNDGFSLTNCELFNFDRTGVLVAAGNGNLWTISNNSFYYNAAALPTAAQTGIDFRPGMAAPATLAAYPTQFGPELTVALSHPTAVTATLRLLDALGRAVWQQEQALLPGAAPVRVQPTCAAGSYVLTATVGGKVLRQRVVKD